ncbi:MAG: ferrous iron transport protein B [Deltaproteobacteria bacterium]|nr:ferrous iron transport protein B [Deltaproteobacteria bacterium]
MTRVALVGSPNSGKTTLFNALTGSRQKTGNYAGVTIEKKEGIIELAPGRQATLLDLPGAYSLDARTPDEAITAEMVRGARADESRPEIVIAVADSTNLERNLYLVLQLKEQKLPLVVALTMSDLAEKQGIEVRREKLEQALGVPVVVTSAVKRRGLKELIDEVRGLADRGAEAPVPGPAIDVDNSSARIIERYQTIEATLKSAVSRKQTARDVTRAIDRVLLHKVLGPLILFVAFALMFQLIFSFAKIPMDALAAAVSLLQDKLRAALPPGDFQSLLVDGVIAGVGAVVVFLPQILLLFAFILLFEDSGYLARAAFILDRLMSRVGLSGRAFIPLLSSFACAIPGIMASRTVENRRDRLITIMVSPLMTCSARIPVYTMLIAAFVPATRVFGVFTLQGLVMSGLYFFGIVAALVVAAVLKRTVLKSGTSSFVMELPTYKIPSARNLLLGLYDRARIFLRRAGTIILGVSVVLWALATYPKTEAPRGLDDKAVAAYRLEHSIAGRAGRAFEPLIRPLGYDWKIGVALISSFAAREVVLSTLGTVYAIGYDKENNTALVNRVRQEKTFTLATAVSLLVFYALALQCVSTIAITRRETNSWRWPAFMFAYMTTLAYTMSWLAYRVVTFLA